MSDDENKQDDILDISADDLDAEPEEPAAPQAPPPADQSEALPAPPLPGGDATPTQATQLPAVPQMPVEIDLDLSDLDVEPGQATGKPAPLTSGVPLSGPVNALPGDMMAKGKKQSTGEAFITATLNILPLAVAGGLGALLGWAIVEPSTRDLHELTNLSEVLRHTFFFFGVTGACIAGAIGSVEGITDADWRRALRGAGLGILIGLFGGGFGGILAQDLYGALHGGQEQMPELLQIAVRSMGWALAGLFIGLAPGIIARARGKLVNGIVGGLIGGALGGFLFDPIARIVGVGSVSRLVALGVLGVASGMAIAVVEQVRKEAWLVISAGPLTGKQFILYNQTTNLGRSPSADIPLMKELGAAPRHCRIVGGQADYTLEDLSGGATLVNGRPTSRHRLVSGDVIQIGNTGLTFYERAAGKK